MKKQKQAWVDDGRVIAGMNLDGMPGILGMPRTRRRFDEFGQIASKGEPIRLTKAERRAISRGVGAAHAAALLWMVLFLAALALLCIVWLRV